MDWREVKRSIRREIDKSLRDPSYSSSMLRTEVESLLSLWNPPHKIAERILEEASSEYREAKGRIADEALRRRAASIVETAGSEFARTNQGITRSVAEIVDRALRDDLSKKDIEGELENQLGRWSRHYSTIARTALGAADTAVRVSQAEKAGVSKFRYVGAPAERDFCREHLGKEYTLDEIKKMNNGQGLDVLLYRGGFNCRHQWIPVVSSSPAALPQKKTVPVTVPDVKKQKKKADEIVNKGTAEETREQILERLAPLGVKDAHLTMEKERGQELDARVWKNFGGITTQSGAVRSLTVRAQGRGFYDHSAGVINIGEMNTKIPNRSVKTVYHEIGHAVHYTHRDKDLRFGLTYKFKGTDPLPAKAREVYERAQSRLLKLDASGTFESTSFARKRNAAVDKLIEEKTGKKSSALFVDKKSFVPNFDPKTQPQTAAILDKYGASFDEFRTAIGTLDDTIEAVTNGRNGFGHGKAYYSTGNADFAECVAHAFEYRFAKFGNGTLREFIDDFAPEFGEFFDEIASSYCD